MGRVGRESTEKAKTTKKVVAKVKKDNVNKDDNEDKVKKASAEAKPKK